MPAKKKPVKKEKEKEKEKTLESKLAYNAKFSWEGLSKDKEKKVYALCEEYMHFLSEAKTEREAVVFLKDMLEKAGALPIEKMKAARPGALFYTMNRKKNIAVFKLGKRPLSEGLNLIAAHVDAPRLDLKQNPLYEDGETKLALLRTHYYGGIKKYQWANIPLAIHGCVSLANGKHIDIKIGEAEDDPVFTITDLLPHLAHKKQEARKLSEGLRGEELQILVGSRPMDEKKAKKKVKLWVLDYLNKKYGMVEEDFISSEFELVPADKARDVGFDRALIGAYGQDDRICSFTAIKAIMDMPTPERAALVLLFDKEETGSDGPTGVKSRFLMNSVGCAMSLYDKNYRDSELRVALERSYALSADVNAGINPLFKDVHEEQNAAKLGYGIIVTKFTGSGGKYSSNDANAEFVGKVRGILNKNKVPWQAAELGKVDEGGGGTVAKFLAEHNMDVLDCGPGLISMHSPFEISSKIDVFHCVEAYTAFMCEMK